MGRSFTCGCCAAAAPQTARRATKVAGRKCLRSTIVMTEEILSTWLAFYSLISLMMAPLTASWRTYCCRRLGPCSCQQPATGRRASDRAAGLPWHCCIIVANLRARLEKEGGTLGDGVARLFTIRVESSHHIARPSQQEIDFFLRGVIVR